MDIDVDFDRAFEAFATARRGCGLTRWIDDEATRQIARRPRVSEFEQEPLRRRRTS